MVINYARLRAFCFSKRFSFSINISKLMIFLVYQKYCCMIIFHVYQNVHWMSLNFSIIQRLANNNQIRCITCATFSQHFSFSINISNSLSFSSCDKWRKKRQKLYYEIAVTLRFVCFQSVQKQSPAIRYRSNVLGIMPLLSLEHSLFFNLLRFIGYAYKSFELTSARLVTHCRDMAKFKRKRWEHYSSIFITIFRL